MKIWAPDWNPKQKFGWCLAMFFSLSRLFVGWLVVVRVWNANGGLNNRTAWITWALYCFVVVSDKLDGWISRQFEAESNSGKFIDQFVDKLVMWPLLFATALWIWQTDTLYLNEALVALSWLQIGLCAIRVGQDVVSLDYYFKLPGSGSKKLGQFKTVFDMLGCFITISAMVLYTYQPFTRYDYLAVPAVICLIIAVTLAHFNLRNRGKELDAQPQSTLPRRIKGDWTKALYEELIP